MPVLLLCAFVLFLTVLVPAVAAEDPLAFIARELNAGQKSLVVPPGQYRLTPQGDVYLKLKDLRGVTIDFTNVEFIGLVNTRMLEIENCSDLALKGLTIDFEPLAFTQARIVEVDAEKNWTVKILDGYPTEGIGSGEQCWPIQVYGRESLELVNPMRFRVGIAVTRITAETYRIAGGENRVGEVGDIAVFTCNNVQGKGLVDAVFSHDCVNLSIENFTLYSTPRGYAFKEFGNTKSVYLNCRLDRRPPETDPVRRELKRLRSGSHDAFTCKCAPIGPQIIGCTARYHGDDCVNISGLYCIVTHSAGDELRVLSARWPVKLLETGDSLQLMTYDGQCPPDAKALSVVSAGECTSEEEAFVQTLSLWPSLRKSFRIAYDVKLDREITLPRGSVVMANNRCGDGFLVKDCTFGQARARGLLIKASRGVIENNTIAGCWANGMQISTEYEWMSGGCSSELRIVGNRLSGNHGFAIGVSGVSGTGSALPANSHRNLSLTGNKIFASNLGIQVTGCTGLEVVKNEISIISSKKEDALRLKNVADVTQADNTIEFLPSENVKK